MVRYVSTLSDDELRELLRPPFASALRKLRRQRRLSQDALGERAGVDRTYVSMMERGCRTPSLTTLARLAEGLGITLQELIGAFERELEGGRMSPEETPPGRRAAEREVASDTDERRSRRRSKAL
jgi:transcriptional regulator with XRE-family HTH domain